MLLHGAPSQNESAKIAGSGNSRSGIGGARGQDLGGTATISLADDGLTHRVRVVLGWACPGSSFNAVTAQ
ncbi:MAG: hypothetical protein ACXW15_06105, partial [Acidimicrobiia bacterium]